MGNYEPRYDLGGSEGWDKDLEHGLLGENLVETFRRDVAAGSFEVKTDKYHNGRMVVETDQNPGGRGWKESGINVTGAIWWAYVHNLDGGMTIVKVERLRRYIDMGVKSGKLHKRDFAEGTENPTRGYLLFPDAVKDLLNNPLYNAPEEYDDLGTEERV